MALVSDTILEIFLSSKFFTYTLSIKDKQLKTDEDSVDKLDFNFPIVRAYRFISMVKRVSVEDL